MSVNEFLSGMGCKKRKQKTAWTLQELWDGFCGPSVVVRRYLSVAATCKDLYELVMTEGLAQFAEGLPDAALTAFKEAPDRLTLNELKASLSRILFLCHLCLTSHEAQKVYHRLS